MFVAVATVYYFPNNDLILTLLLFPVTIYFYKLKNVIELYEARKIIEWQFLKFVNDKADYKNYKKNYKNLLMI